MPSFQSLYDPVASSGGGGVSVTCGTGSIAAGGMASPSGRVPGFLSLLSGGAPIPGVSPSLGIAGASFSPAWGAGLLVGLLMRAGQQDECPSTVEASRDGYATGTTLAKAVRSVEAEIGLLT